MVVGVLVVVTVAVSHDVPSWLDIGLQRWVKAVSYTHLRAHETVLDLVCRLLLEINTL